MKKLLIIIVSVLFFAGCSANNQKEETLTIPNKPAVPKEPTAVKTQTDNSSVRIKNIGVNLDYYNPTTGRAGDFEFFKIKPPYDRLLTDFGHIIPAKDTAEKIDKVNPHPSLILPLGTKVRALIDGMVVDVPKLYSNDYSIQMSKDGTKNDLVFELEHVKNVLVKAGDRVTAGQLVAEVTDFGNHNYPGYGSMDIAVLTTKKDGQPQHLCPFLYLDDSIKEEIFKKIRAFYTAWEQYVGNDKLYNENAYKVPGCINTDPVDG
jgi:biotin carboxyl carrier protein